MIILMIAEYSKLIFIILIIVTAFWGINKISQDSKDFLASNIQKILSKLKKLIKNY